MAEGGAFGKCLILLYLRNSSKISNNSRGKLDERNRRHTDRRTGWRRLYTSKGTVRPIRYRDVGAIQFLLDAGALHALSSGSGRGVRVDRGRGYVAVFELSDVRVRKPSDRRPDRG